MVTYDGEEVYMIISATRHSFWNYRNSQTLRFTEHAPPKAECDHSICNCTRNVAERPTGEPSSVNQLIELIPPQLHLRSEFRLHNGWLTFRWDLTPEAAERCIFNDQHILINQEPHAYFMFHPEQRSVKIQVMVPGYGLTDYFFADLYLGKKIDVSRFINGHSPSKIVNLSGDAHKLTNLPISEENLWLHRCNWGVEEMRVFEDGEEARSWMEVILLMERLNQLTAKYQTKETFNWPIEDVRKDVITNLEISKIAIRVATYCEQVVLDLPTTHLFKLQHEIDQKLKDAHV